MGIDLFIEAKFSDKSPLVALLQTRLANLPSAFVPKYFGDGEKPLKRPQFEIANEDYFQEYLRRHEYGVTLFGDGFSAFSMALDKVPSSLLFHLTKMDPARIVQIIDLFRLFDDVGVIYAHAGLDEETDDRNGCNWRLSTSGSPGHGWIGRDFQKYVPGLYWMNYFSDSYVQQHAINVAELATDLDIQPVRLPGGFVLRLYDSPLDWNEHAGRIQEVVFNTPNFFSRRRVYIPEVVTIPELDPLLSRLHKEWP